MAPVGMKGTGHEGVTERGEHMGRGLQLNSHQRVCPVWTLVDAQCQDASVNLRAARIFASVKGLLIMVVVPPLDGPTISYKRSNTSWKTPRSDPGPPRS